MLFTNFAMFDTAFSTKYEEFIFLLPHDIDLIGKLTMTVILQQENEVKRLVEMFVTFLEPRMFFNEVDFN